MDITHLLNGLNPGQREAVCAPPGPLLVLAGAGSGKTRVLTHRVAWVMATEGLSPHAILAVTFTNKAAHEMRGRIEAMLGAPVSGMWIGTFHGLSHRLLRAHWREANLPQTFQILDAEDQYRAIRRVLKALELEEAYWPPRQAQWFINGHKDAGRRPQHLPDGNDPHTRTLTRVYREYEAVCQRSGLVDFAELLLRAYELLRDNAAIRGHYQARFRHVLVDEFQDTNAIQYAWLKLMSGGTGNLFAVGDDDQCLARGTPVSLSEGKRKAIECIAVGDRVLSCFGSGDFRPSLVTDVYRRIRRGAFIVLHMASGRRIESTPEHTHLAGFALGETPQCYFTYLMFKFGVGYRLGTSQVYTRGQARPMVGFKQRSLQEHADALWVIGVHQSENEARMDEMLLSLRYGIPTLPFVPRKGGSRNGLVHDARLIARVFAEARTEPKALKLLRDVGLDPRHPHHSPQSRNSNRWNVVVTLCGDRRGARPMHRISVVGTDVAAGKKLRARGYSIRPAKRGSRSWRFETCRADFREILSAAHDLRDTLDGRVILQANLNGRSLPFTKASSVRPGMVLVTQSGDYDVVTKVETLRRASRTVYDINVSSTHNFVANGVVTHNSIYGWRGALVDNMLRFEKDHAGGKLLRLEQNYRSTQTILSAANQVIRNNDGRLGKELWTEGPKGESIKLFSAYNDFEEARFVVDRVNAWTEAGGKRAECAVLYRSNAQSRVIEEALIAQSVPYRVYGGLRFFERAEIKDALAYLRLITNRADDASFERVVNVPTRGIGDRTIEAVRLKARAETISLWESSMRLVQSGELAARAAGALRAFLQLIERLAHEIETLSLGEQADLIVRGSGLLDYHKADKSDRAESRAENLEELASAAGAFEYEPSEEMTPLDAFLAHAALEAGEREANPWEDCVQLMSLHAAKGLEFPVVFLTGLEEGLFPHQRSVDEPGKLEEERRLCYVGMTRAMKSLFITYAENRRLHGQEHYTTPSRFLSELPPECVEEVRAKPRHSTFSASTAMPPPGPVPERIRLGTRVRHTKFGEGVILTVEGQGEHTRVQVNFAGLGAKWLVAAYANLEML